jgi:hypothetical protein
MGSQYVQRIGTLTPFVSEKREVDTKLHLSEFVGVTA